MVAKELVVTYGLTQIQASEILGTTQAAVSQYINSKRAIKGGEKFSHLLSNIQNIANYTAQQLSNKQVTWKEVTADFCNICSNMIEEETNKTVDNYSI
jgi:predicted transcriptional regulator